MAHPNLPTENSHKSQIRLLWVGCDVLILFFLTATLLTGCSFDLNQTKSSQEGNLSSLSGDVSMLIYSYNDPDRTLAAYIFNLEESEVWLLAGSYHVEVKLVDGTLLSFSPLLIANEKNGKGTVDLNAHLSEPIGSKEASQQFDTLVRFLVAVDNVRLTYFEIISNGFSEPLFSNTTNLSWDEETLLVDAFSSLGDQKVVSAAAQGFLATAETYTNNAFGQVGLSLPSPGLINNILSFFSILSEEDERAKQEILAMYDANMQPGEKEEAFLALDENQLAGANNFDEFIQKVRNGEIENHVNIRRDLMTLGPMEGIMMSLSPDSNRPGGEVIHRVGSEAIRRGAELNVEVIKTVLSSSFPSIEEGFNYADRANEWAEYVQGVYTDPVGALREELEGQAIDAIEDQIKTQFQMLFPDVEESDVDQYVDQIVEQISTTVTTFDEIADDENLSSGTIVDIYNETTVSDASEDWTIDQCSAIQDVTTELSEFIEHDDGNGNISCAYSHTFTNIGNQPIRLIYYDRYYPSDLYSQPSEWKSHTVIQPGELAGMRSNIFQNTYADDLLPRYECFVFSLAFVYEIPECRWITEDESFHIDILHIAEEELILAPCTLISPVSYSDAVPDISEGLRH